MLKLKCACCGIRTKALKQWWNRDKGYGVCEDCFEESVKHDGIDASISCYGHPGIHHSINKGENHVS